MEPDLAVYAAPESTNLSWREMPPPLLVVEVLSPSTRRRDRHRKRPTYLSYSVGEVWLVDQDTRTIERWTSASEFPETFRDGITWTPDSSLSALVVSDAELFGVRG
ncbi:MAG: Uma2 family endonuclease [Gemmatimonadaceae bacterium]